MDYEMNIRNTALQCAAQTISGAATSAEFLIAEAEKIEAYLRGQKRTDARDGEQRTEGE